MIFRQRGPEANIQAFSTPHVQPLGSGNSTSAIVVLEDDPTIRKLFYFILERTHRVATAGTADEALRLCELQKEHIRLLIADVCLGSTVSGTQAAIRVREVCPDIPILFSSGLPLECWRERDLADLKMLIPGKIDLLQKPFDVRTLMDKIDHLTNGDFSTSGLEKLYAEAETYRRGLKSSAGIRQS
jgi:DNA-binding NtrC family response regulator